jgi:hypothetical protein
LTIFGLDFGEAKKGEITVRAIKYGYSGISSEFNFARAFCYFLASQKVNVLFS